ncbi:hypothetical protein MMC13_000689 [Lambiella insularis]|nr:hypothetical protein [Lambiella insularis]
MDLHKKPSRPRSISEPTLPAAVVNTEETDKTAFIQLVALDSDDGNEDLSDDEDDVSLKKLRNRSRSSSSPHREVHAYTEWAAKYIWSYFSILPELFITDYGINAFRRPQLPHFNVGNIRRSGWENVPGYLMYAQYSTALPIFHYNDEKYRIEIYNHSQPWRDDIRNDPNHPDYLPPHKLRRYQACEYLGYLVFRHDRKAHLLADMREHWKECGDPSTVRPMITDEQTQPMRFYRRYPAIKDKNGYRSFEKHRQRTYAIFNKGQYTLFPKGSITHIVQWPSELTKIYKPRIERLLNIALLDQEETGVIRYLYQLLRLCLRLQRQWTEELCSTLDTQFWTEFEWDATYALDDDPCECYWLGDAANPRKCLSTCKELSTKTGGLHLGPGTKSRVERLEALYWPLRVWQRQHPNVRNWRYRLYGEGFPGVPREQRVGNGRFPNEGPGFQGWGAETGEVGSWRVDFDYEWKLYAEGVKVWGAAGEVGEVQSASW